MLLARHCRVGARRQSRVHRRQRRGHRDTRRRSVLGNRSRRYMNVDAVSLIRSGSALVLKRMHGGVELIDLPDLRANSLRFYQVSAHEHAANQQADDDQQDCEVDQREAFPYPCCSVIACCDAIAAIVKKVFAPCWEATRSDADGPREFSTAYRTLCVATTSCRFSACGCLRWWEPTTFSTP